MDNRDYEGKLEKLYQRVERLEHRVNNHLGPDREAERPLTEPCRTAAVPPPTLHTLRWPEDDDLPQPQQPRSSLKTLLSLKDITPELELRFGRHWLNRLGVAAVVLGAVFFLGYAFQNNLIGNLGRVVLGLLLGMIMLAGGEIVQRKGFRSYGQGLTAGGIAIVYASLYVAGNVYHLIGYPLAFGLLSVVTALSVVLAIRYDSHIIAVQGLLAGFLTPALLTGNSAGAAGENDGPAGLLAYLTLLNTGLLLIALLKDWRYLASSCLGLTTILLLAWSGDSYRQQLLAVTLAGCSLLFLLFIAYAALAILRRQPAGWSEPVLMAAAAAVYYLAAYAMLSPVFPAYMGLFTLVPALLFLPLGLLLLRCRADDRLPGVFTLGLSLTFTTIAVPVQFKLHFLTIAWGIEGALIVWMGLHFAEYRLRLVGLGLLATVFIRLLFMTGLPSGKLPFLGSTFITSLIIIALLALSGRILRRHSDSLLPEEKLVPDILAVAANVAFTLGMTREIIAWGSLITNHHIVRLNPLLSLVWGINAVVLILWRRLSRNTVFSGLGLLLLIMAACLAFSQTWYLMHHPFSGLHLAAPLLLAAAILLLASEVDLLAGGKHEAAALIRLGANILTLYALSLSIIGASPADSVLGYLVIFWNAYVLILFAVARRRRETALPATMAGGLLLLSFSTLITMYNAAHAVRGIAALNLPFISSLTTVMLLAYTGFTLYKLKWPETASAGPVPVICANIVALWLFSYEVYYWGQTSLSSQLAAALISPVWGVYAAALVWYGIARNSRSLRLMGLAVFCLTTVKVLIIDMSVVAVIYRSLTLVGLGLFLLLASYLYQQFGGKAAVGEDKGEL